MAGLLSALNSARTSLEVNQKSIEITGNNISNVNTEGYSRQAVRFEARTSLDYYPGQIGQGVTAAEVYRYFDKFIEKSYLDKFTSQSRYEEQNGILLSIQNLFNESSTAGISSLFDQFMKDWQQVAQTPDDLAARVAMLSNTQNFTKVIQSTDDSMAKVQQEIDRLVQANVDEANTLIQKIADLNRQIKIHDEPGKNNANSLLDSRDKAVRDLAEIIDVDIIDSGGGNYVVNTRAGKTLVDGANNFALAFEGPRAENNLLPNSQYAGTVGFSGGDYNEYTLKRMAVMADKRLTEVEKAQKLKALFEQLPSDWKENVEQLNKLEDLRKLTAAIKAREGSSAEIQQMRMNLVGPEVTQRLENLDKQRSEWKDKVGNYLSARDSIVKSGMSEDAKQKAVQQLRDQYFEKKQEQLRLSTFESVHDRGGKLPFFE